MNTHPATRTRESKEEFLRSFGASAVRVAILRLYARHGLDMLSDEMLEALCAQVEGEWILSRQVAERNRAMSGTDR